MELRRLWEARKGHRRGLELLEGQLGAVACYVPSAPPTSIESSVAIAPQIWGGRRGRRSADPGWLIAQQHGPAVHGPVGQDASRRTLVGGCGGSGRACACTRIGSSGAHWRGAGDGDHRPGRDAATRRSCGAQGALRPEKAREPGGFREGAGSARCHARPTCATNGMHATASVNVMSPRSDAMRIGSGACAIFRTRSTTA